jgi:uncharacterized repeat protein (TIGR01451 family)
MEEDRKALGATRFFCSLVLGLGLMVGLFWVLTLGSPVEAQPVHTGSSVDRTNDAFRDQRQRGGPVKLASASARTLAGEVSGQRLSRDASFRTLGRTHSAGSRNRNTAVVEPPAADLWVETVIRGDLSSIENVITYCITYGNDGTLAAQDVALTDTLPLSMTHLQRSGGSTTTLANGTVVWQLGTVPPGSGGKLLVGARVKGSVSTGTVFTNTVEAATTTPELDYANNLAMTTLGPPLVACVPWAGDQPHRVWSGLTTILKGTARGYGLTSFEWNPGNGSLPITGTVPNGYAISARQTYSAALGTIYTATLTVWGAFGWSDTDTYTVQVFTPTHGIKVDVAVDEALWYIHRTARRYQFRGVPRVTWDIGKYYVAMNASAIQAFQLQGHLPNGDPREDPYVEDVQGGWNTLFTYAKPDILTVQSAGNPDSDGDGIGIGIYASDEAAIYESGLAMLALATTGSPDPVARTGPPTYVRGQTYYSITQDMADWFAWGQNDTWSGEARGGWRYQPNSGESDNSNTQFPVLGLAAAEHNWGIVVPTWVKNELRNYWLAYTQDASGGFGYMGPGDWINVGKTGAGTMDLAWTGVPVTDTRIASAAQFIEAHWDDEPDGDWNGNVGEFYAMYAVKKGSQLAGIHNYGPHVWDYEYSFYLVEVQQPGGGIDGAGNMRGYPTTMNTAWAVMILSPGLYQALPVPAIPPFLRGGAGPEWDKVRFDATASYHTDPDRRIVLFEWDFGDGSPVVTTTSSITTHTYPTRGVYLATLTVWDDAGNRTTAAIQVSITGPGYHPPVADPDGPYDGRIGQEIILDGSGSHDPDEWMGDSVVLYEWNITGDAFYTTTESTLAYTGTVSGTFPITLRVLDQGLGYGPDSPRWSEPATTTVTISREVPTPTAVPPTDTPAVTTTKEPHPEPDGRAKPLVLALALAILAIIVVSVIVARAFKRSGD